MLIRLVERIGCALTVKFRFAKEDVLTVFIIGKNLNFPSCLFLSERQCSKTIF